MRIVFLLSQDLESPSGLGRYWPLGKALGKLGHEVTILALHPDYAALQPQNRSFVRERVHVRYVGQMHVRKVGNQKSYFKPARLLQVASNATLQLTRAALRAPADVYHVGKPHPMNGLAGLFASRLRQKPLYLDCDDFEAASNRFEAAWQERSITIFERTLPRASEGITTNTRFMIDKLLDWGVPDERVVYVPNGAERSRFSGTDPTVVEQLRQQLGLVDQKVVLYVGSLSLTSHAVDLLLEGFAAARQILPRTVLVLVGGGEDYERLRRYAIEDLGLGDSVRFVGRVAPEQVPYYYVLANVSVDPVYDSPGASARSPLKVIESLTMGTPVITGDVGDRDVTLDSGGGLLVPPGDAAALARSLLEVLQDDELLSRLSAQALQARTSYYWDVLVHQFAQIYTSS